MNQKDSDAVAPAMAEVGSGKGNESLWAAGAMLAAFGTYFCMYAFRKPFTAAQFTDVTVYGLTFKSVLVTSQVIGYSISKFIGIKVISEMKASRRAQTLLGLIGNYDVTFIRAEGTRQRPEEADAIMRHAEKLVARIAA